jgi:hypothetical protein
MQESAMNIKLLIALLWIFFLAFRNTGELLWQFCLIYCGVLVVCALFYQWDRQNHPQKGRQKK